MFDHADTLMESPESWLHTRRRCTLAGPISPRPMFLVRTIPYSLLSARRSLFRFPDIHLPTYRARLGRSVNQCC